MSPVHTAGVDPLKKKKKKKKEKGKEGRKFNSHDALHGIGKVAQRPSPRSECYVTIVSGREFKAIDAEEDAPDNMARIAGDDPKNREKYNSYIAGARNQFDVDRDTTFSGSLPGPQPIAPIEKAIDQGTMISVVIR